MKRKNEAQKNTGFKPSSNDKTVRQSASHEGGKPSGQAVGHLPWSLSAKLLRPASPVPCRLRRWPKHHAAMRPSSGQ